MDGRIGVSTKVEGNVAGSGATQVNAPIVGRDLTYNVIHRDEKEILQEKRNKCRDALFLTNPASDRGKITSTKGNPVKNTCKWIEEADPFKNWLQGPTTLLWIFGGPGKGKTFLSIHLAENLPLITTLDNPSKPLLLEYYCDNGDSQRNTAISVLRGLLYQLLEAEGGLYDYILREFELHQARHENIFSEVYKEELWLIFNTMISNVPRQIYMVLDGLDECDEVSTRFLQTKLEALHSAESTEGRRNIKTVLVSRKFCTRVRNALRINLDQEHIERREEDLKIFIQDRIRDIAGIDQWCTQLEIILLKRANGMFLWVALAISVLKDNTETEVQRILQSRSAVDTWLPQGLDAMYNRILTDVPEAEREIASKVVRCVCIALRPLTAEEVCAVTGLTTLQVGIHIEKRANLLSRAKNGQLEPIHFSLKEYLLRIPSTTLLASISSFHNPLLHAASFILKRTYLLYAFDFVLCTNILLATILLSVQNPLSYTIPTFCVSALCSVVLYILGKSTVTPSFLITGERSLKVYAFGIQEQRAHTDMLLKCLTVMSGRLTKNGCKLRPGTLASEINKRDVETYLPSIVQYACYNWVEHLQKSKIEPHNHGKVYMFLQKLARCLPAELQHTCEYWVQHLQGSGTQPYDDDRVHRFLREHLLHWLEALSWMGKTSEGILAISSLEAQILANKSPNLYAFVHDTKRFVLYNRLVIEQAPLQLYCSALIFAPEKSIVRRRFEKCIPTWIQMKPRVQVNWSAALQTLEGHLDRVNSVAFSLDGKLVVSGSHDRTVKLWDAVTGAALQTLEGHSGPVTSVAFSLDSKLVASGSGDKTVKLWDAVTGAALRTLEGHSDWVSSVDFSPDGKLVASGSHDKTVGLWDAVTGAALRTLGGHSYWVSSVTFSPDGKLVASGSHDMTVRLWDAVMGAALQTLKGHSGSVTSVAFSPDSKLVASGSGDNTVRLWDAVTGVALQTLRGHLDWVHSVAFSPDGKLVASGLQGKTVRLWDAITGAALQTLEGHSGPVTSVAFSLDSKLVASGSGDNAIRLWDAVTGVALQTLEGHSGPVRSVVFSPDGKLVVSGSHDKTVKLWDAVTGAALQTLEGHWDRVNSVAFSPDGKLVASGLGNNTVRLWDAVTGAALQTLEGHSDWVSLVAFSPDGKLVASGSGDKTVRLWDAVTGAALRTLKGHWDRVNSVAFSPDGKLVVSGSGDKIVMLWDAITGEVLRMLGAHWDWVSSVAFSPDGKLVASGSGDKTVKLWDAVTGAALQTLEGHWGWVSSVAFSPDGKLVASGSGDKTVRLWDIVTGAALQTFEISLVINTLLFSTSGQYLKTDRGVVDITSPKVSLDSLEQLRALFVSNNWVIEEGENILWLPPNHRATCVAVWNATVVLGHLSGGISFLQFKEGPKLI